MTITTERLLEEIPGEPLKNYAATFQKCTDVKGIPRTTLRNWVEFAFRDNLGNIWLDDTALESVLCHRGFAQLSRCSRELDPDVVTVDDGNKTYIRGPLLENLLETVVSEADQKGKFGEKAAASLGIYRAITRFRFVKSESVGQGQYNLREHLNQLQRLIDDQRLTDDDPAGDETEKRNAGWFPDLLSCALLHLGESLEKHRLTHRRYHLLRLIENGGASLPDLAPALGLSSAGVTGEVDALQKQNRVQRHNLHVSLTESGSELVNNLKQQTRDWISNKLTSDDEERRKLSVTAQRIKRW